VMTVFEVHRATPQHQVLVKFVSATVLDYQFVTFVFEKDHLPAVVRLALGISVAGEVLLDLVTFVFDEVLPDLGSIDLQTSVLGEDHLVVVRPVLATFVAG
jgi:hypothetical protein